MPNPNEYHAEDSDDNKDHMTADDISILKQLSNAPVAPQADARAVKKAGIDHAFHEFYSTQSIFIAAMASIDYPLPKGLAKVLTPQEKAELEKFLEPFSILRENPFYEGKLNPSNKAKVEALFEQATSKAFDRTISAMETVTVEYSSFTRFLIHLKEKKSIAANPVLLAEVAALEFTGIQAVQRFPRFELLAKAINTEYSKAIEKVPEPESEATQKTCSDLFAHFQAHVVKINEAKRVGEKMELVKAFIQYTPTTPPKPILESLAKQIGDTDLDKGVELVTKAYVDAYLEGRTATSTGTDKSPDLKALDEVLSHAIDNHFDPSIQKPERLILTSFSKIDVVRNSLVSHLFNRAMLEGIVDSKQKQIIYTNALKAIVRMGNAAVNDWNALITSKLGPDAPRIESVDMKESAINSSHSAMNKLPDVKTRILAAVYPAQTAILNDYVKAFKDAAARENFIELYLDTYINERTKVGSHTEKGPLLTQLDEAFSKLYKDNKKDFSGSSKSTPDSLIFNAANQDPALAARLTERALQRVIASVDAKDPKTFVNALKAVARMDTGAQWDKLIETKYPQHANLKIEKNSVLDKKMSESSIEKLYANVSQPGRGPSESMTGKRSRGGLFDKLSVTLAGSRSSISRSSSKPAEEPNSPTSPTNPPLKRIK